MQWQLHQRTGLGSHVLDPPLIPASHAPTPSLTCAGTALDYELRLANTGNIDFFDISVALTGGNGGAIAASNCRVDGSTDPASASIPTTLNVSRRSMPLPVWVPVTRPSQPPVQPADTPSFRALINPLSPLVSPLLFAGRCHRGV